MYIIRKQNMERRYYVYKKRDEERYEEFVNI
jgi:hypothetical protein